MSTPADALPPGPTGAPSNHRLVTIERLSRGRYVARNSRGHELVFATGSVEEFTAVELLLVAIGGCTSVDVDFVTSRRAEPESFHVTVEGDKAKDPDDGSNVLENIEVTFRVTFPAGAEGDAAREALPEIVRRSHDRLCTVSRTVELGRPVRARVAD